MAQEAGRREGPDSRAVLLVAGLVDLTTTVAGSALGTVRGLFRRSDATELAAEAGRDLMARGRLVLDRCADSPPAHLEVLARHVMARKTVDDV